VRQRALAIQLSYERLNVLGFLTRQNELEAYTFECSINSDVGIACIDKFCEKLTKKTVLIMDNSSIHQNRFLWDKEEEWSKKGLEIFFLPSYSPQLNIIEIFWRFIKYQYSFLLAFYKYQQSMTSTLLTWFPFICHYNYRNRTRFQYSLRNRT
jgi:transposase